MKAKYLFTLFLLTAFVFTSCKDNKKKAQETETTQQVENTLKAIPSSATVKATAYKTTDKVGVPGEFKKVEMDNFGEGSRWKDVLNNATFKIDAFQFDTGNEDRDENIKKGFFENMTDPGKISGKFIQEDENWFVEVTMNGATVKVPAEIDFKDNLLDLKATIDLNKFNAIKALKAFNKLCYDLHKGDDGVSKTWDTVDVEASLKFEEQ